MDDTSPISLSFNLHGTKPENLERDDWLAKLYCYLLDYLYLYP